MSENYAVFVGLDVGKSAHHACALTMGRGHFYVRHEESLARHF